MSLEAHRTVTLVIAGLAFLSAPSANAQETVEVTAKAGLNVRSGPGVRSHKLGALKKGQHVEVLARSTNGRWLRIRTPFFDGWASARYLEGVETPSTATGLRGALDRIGESVGGAATEESEPEAEREEPATAPAVAKKAKRGRVKAPSGLNMRSGPGTRNGKKGALNHGEEVEVLGLSNDKRWLRVKSDRLGEGWVARRHMERTDVADDDHTHEATSVSAGAPRATSSVAPASTPRPSSSSSPRPSSTSSSASRRSSGSVDQRNLSRLNAGFRAKVVRILQRLQAQGWQPYVAEGYRTRAQQREKVRRGFSKTMNSWHLKGLAADIVDRRWGWGGPASKQSHPFWRALGVAARAEGLTWGGDWRSFKDVAHVQQSR